MSRQCRVSKRHEGTVMATIHRRVTRSGHIRYRAQVRIKNQPWVLATFQKLSYKMPAELYKSLTWNRGTEHLELSSSELGVQTISQPIPTEINREHREHDRHPWEGHDPPGERYVGAAVCNHITPARSGLRNSYP